MMNAFEMGIAAALRTGNRSEERTLRMVYADWLDETGRRGSAWQRARAADLALVLSMRQELGLPTPSGSRGIPD